MAIETIPDKICPHCGGNQYSVTYPNDRSGKKFLCIIKKRERERLNARMRKRTLSISDSYVKHCYIQSLKYYGIKMLAKDVTLKQIERQRFKIEVKRKLKSEIMKTAEQKERITTKEMLPSEKRKIYMDRWFEKKQKKNAEKDYEELASLSVNSGIDDTEELKSTYVNNVVEEFKRIELRRQEIINQVNQLNSYLESLKIKLL